MLLVVLGGIAWLGLVMFAIIRITRFYVDRFGARIEAKHRAAEHIVNHGGVPDAWVSGFRERLAEVQRAGGSQQDLERVGQQALEHCLQELDALIHYFEDGRFLTDAEAREILLESLKRRNAEWAASGWRALLLATTDSGDVVTS